MWKCLASQALFTEKRGLNWSWLIILLMIIRVISIGVSAWKVCTCNFRCSKGSSFWLLVAVSG